MQLQDLTTKLYDFFKDTKIIFVSWEPASFDSTTLAKLQVKIKFENSKGASLSIPINASNCLIITNILEKINENKKTVFVGHNFKTLFTLFRRLNNKLLNLANVFDLGWYESYYNKPDSTGNKVLQVKYLKGWLDNPAELNTYLTVFSKLIVSTLPAIESNGLINSNLGLLVFPNFVVEGQANGRLSCICEYKRCYNPHSLSEEEKGELHLPQAGELFIWFDYNNMEVSVLAELADDENLKDIITNHPKEVYEKIFEAATGSMSTDARKLAKQMFLPCIYGQGANGLAKSLDISVDQAAIYLHNLRTKFAKSFNFVETAQKEADEVQRISDRFGRVRTFEQGEAFKARNFAIQAPSALLCLEALVNLQNLAGSNFKVIFTVHDGYCIAGEKHHLEEAYRTAKAVLEKPSKFLPVKLNVSAKLGKSLAKMTSIGKR
jgi:DNA polymerase I-like protein with 3'-5' exonuclease and polymerase domains